MIEQQTIFRYLVKTLVFFLLLITFQAQAQRSFLGLDGGFEGTATIVDGTTNATPISTNWSKSTTTATIANETATVRSGDNSIKVTSNSLTACRVFSPSYTISASTSRWYIQYYRLAGNTTNTVQNQSGNYRGGTEALNGTYSSVVTGNTWEKVTYSPIQTVSATTAAANLLVQRKGTGGEMFYDDFVMYEATAIDNTAPSSATAVTVDGATLTSLNVAWTAAAGGVDGGGYMVVRFQNNPSANHDPNVNGIYPVGHSYIGFGDIMGTVRFVGSGTSFTDTDLLPGTTYYYKVYTFDKAYNYAAEAQQSATTLLPTITSFNPTTVCSGSTIIITGTNFTGATAVSFGGIPATSFTVDSNTQITAVVGVGASGTVEVTVTGIVSNLAGFTYLPLPNTPTITAGGPTTFCSGSSVTLTASVASSYLWSTGATTQSITVSTTGYYTVQVTGANGCPSLSSVGTSVTVSTLPTTPVISGSLCSGSTLTISPTNNIQSLVWNLNGSPIATEIALGASSGVTVAGGNGLGLALNQLRNPVGVFLDSGGNIYVADTGAHRIQRWAQGATTGVTVAGGNGGSGFESNRLNFPEAVYVDGGGTIYIADTSNHRIQRWSPGATSGVTVAGGNGAGSAANQFNVARDVFVDGSGNIYVADQLNHRIQRWAPGSTSGVTVAGGNGQGSGANQLRDPLGVRVDANGTIYIADTGNSRVQRWALGASSGVTVAGGNGPGSGANQLSSPRKIHVDDNGTVYIADTSNNRIQRWESGATTGVTVAGGNGAGSATNQLNTSNGSGVFVDSSGSIYIADNNNHRIQRWTQSINNTSLSNVSAGVYTATVTNFSGCSSTSMPVTINDFPETPTITAGGSTTFCSGGSVTLTSSTGSSYLWSTGATTQSIMVSTSGNYTVQVTNVNGCQSASSLPIIVTINSLPVTPTITVDGSTTFCNGGSVTLTSNSGNSYLWSTGATTQSITVSTAGNYSVQVTNELGCQSEPSATSTVIVNAIPTKPTITANGATTFCADQSVTLTSSPGASYLWSTGATTQSIVVTTSGNYSVQVYSANGCVSPTSNSRVVNVLPSCPSIAILKLYIEGYFDTAIGAMRPVRNNQDSVSPISQVENLTIELHNPLTYETVATTTGVLSTDGTLIANFTNVVYGSYYIVVKGNNLVQTWSASPQLFGSTISSYDFTTAATMAYGDNMVEVQNGVWAIYSGDVNQDELVDPTDYSLWETDTNNFAFGVFVTDLNGDGNVDPTDYSIWEQNTNNFVYSIHP